MKTKIVNLKNVYKLVVDDELTNQVFKCSSERPILLGVITEFYDSDCWSVQDYRLKKNLMPSEYLLDGTEEMKPEDEAQKEKILSKLHTYKISKEGIIYWSTFDSVCFDGDNLGMKDSLGNSYPDIARFTFKEAYKRLEEQQRFWDNVDKKEITSDSVRIENPHRQASQTDMFFEFALEKINNKKLKL